MQCKVCLQDTAHVTGVEVVGDEKGAVKMSCTECGEYFIERPSSEEIADALVIENERLVDSYRELIYGSMQRLALFQSYGDDFFEEEDMEMAKKAVTTFETVSQIVLQGKQAGVPMETLTPGIEILATIHDGLKNFARNQLEHVLYFCVVHEFVPQKEWVDDLLVFNKEVTNK